MASFVGLAYFLRQGLLLELANSYMDWPVSSLVLELPGVTLCLAVLTSSEGWKPWFQSCMPSNYFTYLPVPQAHPAAFLRTYSSQCRTEEESAPRRNIYRSSGILLWDVRTLTFIHAHLYATKPFTTAWFYRLFQNSSTIQYHVV